MSTLNVTNISDGTNSTSTTNVVKGSAKAWVRFNGATMTINESYNVGSLTDNGTGDYTVNFTSALEDANYSWSYGVSDGGTTGNIRGCNPTDNLTQTSSAFRAQFMDQVNNLNDISIACLQFFR